MRNAIATVAPLSSVLWCSPRLVFKRSAFERQDIFGLDYNIVMDLDQARRVDHDFEITSKVTVVLESSKNASLELWPRSRHLCRCVGLGSLSI